MAEYALRSETTRRGFVNWLLGTSAGAFLISVLYPVSRYLIPPKVGESAAASVTLPIKPDDGHGARKVKSYMLAGGAIEMKLSISGRRISNCMPIQAPKENPATQQDPAFGL